MKILRVAKAAQPLFLREQRLPIHSVYKNTVNLQSGAQIFALQAAGIPATPFSVGTDLPGGSLEGLFRGETAVLASPRGICAGRNTILLPARYERFDGHYMPGAVPADLIFPAEVLREMLRRLAPRDSFFALAEPSRLAACGRFSGAAEGAVLAMCAENACTAADAAQILAELVGLGQGLTPAGDDFLVGVLAALDMARATTLRTALCAALRLQKTNAISAGFLRAAADSDYAEALLALLRARDGGAVRESLESCALRVLQTGHTSGSDTLGGMLWCMDRIERKKREWFPTVR